MSDLGLLLRLQARVMTFLADLPLARLTALADGRCWLTVVDATTGELAPELALDPEPAARPATPSVAAQPPAPSGVPRPKPLPPPSSFDAETVAARLRSCETVDAGTSLLAGLKLSAVNLKLVAKALNIPPGRTKDETMKKVLSLTVGARGKHAALRQG
jgi:hypothetical protein